MTRKCETVRKLCRDGHISLYSYLGTAALILLPSVPQIYYGIVPNIWGAVLWGPVLYYALINMIIRFILRKNDYQVAIRASLLGFIQAVSILLILFAPTVWKQFGVYGFFMAFFHYSEFLAIAWSCPRSLSLDSFMLNHSIHYGIAAAASWLEFALEVSLLPEFKSKYYIWLLGVALCIIGEVIRKTAIITAQNSFTHLVQFEKSEEQKLITHGVYAYMRHPSYVGWFWWSIGTQFILMNPICIVIYTIVSWKFFHDRIYIEEATLLNFFRSDYHKYQQKVPTGLPFIAGFILD
ncbi:protein-S-isoprenylcysteine O-methyltransferase [Teleopsis dalmanni]|uniref:protein-S-isoprenylcysteine O-methyltransferase n=1 Tax=Teleopsis dalmanni TaxID=139649 RepID=UPI0018CDC230|nr:protein-S-isoprenylcysteine O-methyltransferase [Teleopsis dalmanni]XP_037933164.1 protein-S-isoprenylcysteine O-methyltransferase [Teleopsis dalmanni]